MAVETNTIKSLFLGALELAEPSQRAAYLAEACREDVELRGRIEELLKAHESGSFPDFLGEAAKGFDATLSAAATPNDATQTSAGPGAGESASLSFLSPPREAGHLGRLDHYEVHAAIGQGGMGVVLKAFDESLDRIVAIKVLNSQYAANGTARKRFIREAKAVAAVSHEHVVHVYAVDEQVPYLVMQFVKGLSLQDRIDKSGPLELKEILRIGMQIASGLGAAHAQGIVHRDIKPSNILLENGIERVKITDFGLARAVDDASVTQSGVIAGTPMYMSPEQARGETVDPRSDLFSLGSVLYAMCTGHAPFRASGTMAVMKRVIEDTPRPIREINPEVPDWLCAIVDQLLAKRPEDRIRSAKELANLLEACLAHVQQPERVPLPGGIPKPTQTTASAGIATRIVQVGLTAAGAGFAVQLVVLAFLISRGKILQLAIIGSAVGLGLAVFIWLAWLLKARWKRQTIRSAVVWALALFILPTVFAGMFLNYQLSQPNAAYGELQIDTDDPELIVTVDGRLVPLTPTTGVQLPGDDGWVRGITVMPLETGPHKVRALRNGKEVHSQEIVIERGTATHLRIDRPSEEGWLSQRDEDRLQGAWHAVGGEFAGTPWHANELKIARVRFTGERMHATLPPKGLVGEGTFTLNPTAEPKQITVKATTEGNQALEGIYRFDGNQLVLCIGGGKDSRPKEFKTEVGKSYGLLVLERVPPAKDAPFTLTPPKVLEHMVGSWSIEMTQSLDLKQPATKHVGHTLIEPVAGGRYVIRRTVTDNGGPDDLQIVEFDRENWEFRSTYFDPKGVVRLPNAGRFDAATRTVTSASRPEDGIVRVSNTRFLDADTIEFDVVHRGMDGKTRLDRRAIMKRLKTRVDIAESVAADLPKEMDLLRRLIGTWDVDMASKVRPQDKWKTEMTGRAILGGRFIEMRERILPSGEENYTLSTYDAEQKAFRQWYVSSRWPQAEGTGTWDEAARTMEWACRGGAGTTTPITTSVIWKYASADKTDFRVVVKDKDGKVLEDLEGSHVRRTGKK